MITRVTVAAPPPGFPGLLLRSEGTRLNSSHTEIYALSLHDALPISVIIREIRAAALRPNDVHDHARHCRRTAARISRIITEIGRHTSELQSHRDLRSFPTRRSSDLSNNPGNPRGCAPAKRRS